MNKPITLQHKGLYFRANKNGTYTVKSDCGYKVFKAVKQTFAEATEWIYVMSPNITVCDEFCNKICEKFKCDVFGDPMPIAR